MNTASGTLFLFACIYWSLVRAQAGLDQPQCSETKVTSKKVTISNVLGKQGNAIGNVVFEDDQKKADNGSWLVDVEQKTERCEGIHLSSRLVYTLTAFHQHRVDYELFPGIGYYKFHSEEPVKWPRAREICSQEDAHLVILNSEQEAAAMVKLFARFPTVKGAGSNDWAWVGLQERASAKGLPYTIFGEAWNQTGFTRWAADQPNDATLNDYVAVNKFSGAYADVPISRAWNLAFICEQELW